jgi:hypothetical protein
MSWENIDLTNVPTGMEILPKGTYTFSVLPGAKFSEKSAGRVEFQLAVAAGEFAGKKIFTSYPNPDEYPWSPAVFKRLTVAIGTDVEAGENPVTYLNRVANLHVDFEVKHRTDSTGVERADVNLFAPKPARQ